MDFYVEDKMVKEVLFDLSRTGTIESSLDIGSEILKQIKTVNRVHKKKVQQAGFAVLKAPNVPSVLIETAFISNAQDESNLKSVQYQQRLARAMHQGIKSYFYMNPPQGTKVAQLSRSQRLARQHVIRNGDTLSGIAQRYNVSVARIRSANSLNTNSIRAGQVLRIPPAVET